MPKTYKAAAYLRLSYTGDRNAESDSIANQRKLIEDFVSQHPEIELVAERVDDGYSGILFERPAIQQLIDLVQKGAVNCIIVKDFSRFGRNSMEVEYYLERVFPLYNVRFVALNDGYDSVQFRGDTGGLNVTFRYLINELYSRDLSVKYKSAKYVKFKRGEYQSRVCPYGYKKGSNGRMEPDEEAADVVQLIFELARSGLGAKKIVKALRKRGIPTPAEYKAAHGFTGHDISRSNGIWSESTVARILADERYTGTYIIGKQEVTEVGGHRVRLKDESQWIKIPDHHPAIVSKELYDQVQALRPKINCVKKNVNTYPLRSKVFCGCCGHAMPRTSNKNHAYICRHSQVDDAAPCHGLRIMEAELEQIVYDKMLLRLQTVQGERSCIPLTVLDGLDAKIENCLQRKRSLYERFVVQKLELDEYKVQKAELDNELEQLKQVTGVIGTQTARQKASADQASLLQRVQSAGRLTTELADELVDKVEVYPGGQVEPIWR